jgi:GPI mannosyltransferase 3
VPDDADTGSQSAGPAPALAQGGRGAQAVLLAASAAVQAWAVRDTQGLTWPDEIYQSLEQAHRLVYGYGFVPWEFQEGARSWAWPGALAGVLSLLQWAGVDGAQVPVLAGRSACVVLSLASLALTMRLAAAIGGPGAALAAGLLSSTFPLSLLYASRCLSEVASAPFLAAAALWTWKPPSPRRLALAGLCGGAACLLRYQNGIALLGLIAILGWRSRWRDVRGFLAGAVPVLLAGGALDGVTWGSPFRSVVANLAFNMSHPAAFGAQGALFYAETLLRSTGPCLLLIAAGVLASFRRAPALGLAVVLYGVCHTAVPHKEIRFLLPMVPWSMALAGAGLVFLWERAAGRWSGLAFWVILAMGAASMTHRAVRLTRGDIGYGRAAHASAWRMSEGYNRLLWTAGSRPDLCGIAVTGVPLVWVGGYSYLHRPVPFLDEGQLREGGAASVNYLIAAEEPSLPGFRPVARDGSLRLLHRDGPCEPPPAGYSTALRR